MDRQRLEPRRNAYDAFVTVPRMVPDLAYRYLFDRASFYQQRPTRGDRALTILYLADIRFPLERANGIQTDGDVLGAGGARARRAADRAARHARAARAIRSRSTACRALTGARRSSRRPSARAAAGARRAASDTSSFAAGRVHGRARGADVSMTRDLGLASLLLRLPAAARRSSTNRTAMRPTSRRRCRRLIADGDDAVSGEAGAARRGARRASGAAPTATSRSPQASQTSCAGRFGVARSRRRGPRRRAGLRREIRRSRTPPTPEPGCAGPIAGDRRLRRPPLRVEGRRRAAAARSRRCPRLEGSIVGGHEREPDLARVRALASDARPRGARDVHGTRGAGRRAGAARRGATSSCSRIRRRRSRRTFTSPLKLFEYMAAGRADRRVRSARRSAKCSPTSDTALLVEPGDAAALAAAIRAARVRRRRCARVSAPRHGVEVAGSTAGAGAPSGSKPVSQVLDARTR